MPRSKNEVSSDSAQATEEISTPSKPLFQDFLTSLMTKQQERKDKLRATKQHLEEGKENAKRLNGITLTHK